jgi:hypothetical protein
LRAGGCVAPDSVDSFCGLCNLSEMDPSVRVRLTPTLNCLRAAHILRVKKEIEFWLFGSVGSER